VRSHALNTVSTVIEAEPVIVAALVNGNDSVAVTDTVGDHGSISFVSICATDEIVYTSDRRHGLQVPGPCLEALGPPV
jgi:hypothetical protein